MISLVQVLLLVFCCCLVFVIVVVVVVVVFVLSPAGFFYIHGHDQLRFVYQQLSSKLLRDSDRSLKQTFSLVHDIFQIQWRNGKCNSL